MGYFISDLKEKYGFPHMGFSLFWGIWVPQKAKLLWALCGNIHLGRRWVKCGFALLIHPHSSPAFLRRDQEGQVTQPCEYIRETVEAEQFGDKVRESCAEEG